MNLDRRLKALEEVMFEETLPLTMDDFLKWLSLYMLLTPEMGVGRMCDEDQGPLDEEWFEANREKAEKTHRMLEARRRIR